MKDDGSLLMAYEAWRREGQHGWGLTWYLAAELCHRFYESHGIVPYVICHEGLGYYGIAVAHLPCKINGPQDKALGRFCIAGDVENWRTGGPGDHGLPLEARAEAGEPVAPMVAEAVAYLDLPAFPAKTHLNCRHKRWGASYVLLFHIAALVALRHGEAVRIWNEPWMTRRHAEELDLKFSMQEHPGHLHFERHFSPGPDVLIAGDGRILKPGGMRSLWHRYMQGESVSALARDVEKWLGLKASPEG